MAAQVVLVHLVEVRILAGLPFFFVLKKDRLVKIGKLVYVSTLQPIYDFASRIFKTKKYSNLYLIFFIFYIILRSRSNYPI